MRTKSVYILTFEYSDNPYNILSAQRAFPQLSSTVHACNKMTTLQEYTINDMIHAHFTHLILLSCGWAVIHTCSCYIRIKQLQDRIWLSVETKMRLL